MSLDVEMCIVVAAVGVRMDLKAQGKPVGREAGRSAASVPIALPSWKVKDSSSSGVNRYVLIRFHRHGIFMASGIFTSIAGFARSELSPISMDAYSLWGTIVRQEV